MKTYPTLRKFGVNVVNSATWDDTVKKVCAEDDDACAILDWFGGETMTLKSHELVE